MVFECLVSFQGIGAWTIFVVSEVQRQRRRGCGLFAAERCWQRLVLDHLAVRVCGAVQVASWSRTAAHSTGSCMGIVKKMYSNLYFSKNGVPKRDQEMSNFVGPLVPWNLITFTQLTHFSGSRCSVLPDGRRGRWQKPPDRRTPRLRRPMRQALAAISWMVVSFHQFPKGL